MMMGDTKIGNNRKSIDYFLIYGKIYYDYVMLFYQ